MLAEMSSINLTEWMAFDQLEPFGEAEKNAEYRAGVIASTVANVNIDPKKHKALKVTDFMREAYLQEEREAEAPLEEKIFAMFGKRPPEPQRHGDTEEEGEG